MKVYLLNVIGICSLFIFSNCKSNNVESKVTAPGITSFLNAQKFTSDSAGLYFNEKSIFNPRLFAYVQTDSKGRFYLKTIKPGTYPDDKGSMVIPHIHFNISKVGYRNYNSEFIFTDDSLYYQQGNPESLPEAILKKDGSISEYEVVINLQQLL